MQKPLKILIVGNGFGGVYALKTLHKFFHKDPHVELSLVGEKNYFLFTPLLHEVATGSINPENIIEPIRRVLTCCLKNFYQGKADFINTENRTVKVGDNTLSYDYLILAPGAETNFYGTPGAEQYSLSLKSIEDAIRIKNRAVSVMDEASEMKNEAERKNKLQFAVIGGGPTGVELAAELQELIKDSFPRYYQKEVIKDACVLLIQKNSELLPQFGLKVRKKSLAVLHKKGVKVMLNTSVKEVGDSFIILGDNTKIHTGTVIWVAGVKPAKIDFDVPVTRSGDGRLVVNEYLQLEKHKNIYALGDMAAFKQKGSDSFLPGLAQVAEKEAKNLASNLRLLIKGQQPEPFVYHHSGSMISLGQWMAIGEIANFTFSGGITWWVWRTVYLSKLLSWKKKLEVAFDWTLNIFSSRDISKL